MARVSQLHVYPVKGCRGIAVEKALVQHTGLAFDRKWVIASQDRGRFQSQRSDPRMALIDIHLPTEALVGSSLPEDAALTLRAPGTPELKIPLASQAAASSLTDVIVWDWHGRAADEGDEAAAWISAHLGKPLRLLRYVGDDEDARSKSPEVRRATDPMFADGGETAFSDQLPYLLATEESLQDLNARLKERGAPTVPMNRFRPNITLSGAKPWEEDTWAALHMGPLDFTVALPCARCKVPEVDQETAQPDKTREPTRTLQTFRKGTHLNFTRLPSWKAGVFFGWQLLADAEGLISVGDEVSVTSTRQGLQGLE